MSKYIYAFGWYGHILVPADEADSEPEHNTIAVDRAIFERMRAEREDSALDDRIEMEQLGFGSNEDCPIAVGYGMSIGVRYYGTIFAEADAQDEPGPPAIDHEREYLDAMKEIYGLELPPCKPMIGCYMEG
jgi:hypothetical protein